jgi:hypothetical protein
MRVLTEAELDTISGGVMRGIAAGIVWDAMKTAYNYLTDDGQGGGTGFRDGDETVFANVYGA